MQVSIGANSLIGGAVGPPDLRTQNVRLIVIMSFSVLFVTPSSVVWLEFHNCLAPINLSWYKNIKMNIARTSANFVLPR